MRFSVRDILALTFIAALVAMTLSSARQKRIAAEENLETMRELRQQEFILAQLRVDTRYTHAKVDWLQAKANFTRSAIEQFSALQEKYGTIKSRGADTASIRSIPMLVDEEYDGSNWRMRLLVPAGREVFLKFGVSSHYRNWAPSEKSEPLTDSALVLSGPFEMQLAEGVHDIDVASRVVPEGSLRKHRVSVDQQPVLITTTQAEWEASGSSWPSAREKQLDFPLLSRLSSANGISCHALARAPRPRSASGSNRSRVASSLFLVHP